VEQELVGDWRRRAPCSTCFWQTKKHELPNPERRGRRSYSHAIGTFPGLIPSRPGRSAFVTWLLCSSPDYPPVNFEDLKAEWPKVKTSAQ